MLIRIEGGEIEGFQLVLVLNGVLFRTKILYYCIQNEKFLKKKIIQFLRKNKFIQ